MSENLKLQNFISSKELQEYLEAKKAIVNDLIERKKKGIKISEKEIKKLLGDVEIREVEDSFNATS